MYTLKHYENEKVWFISDLHLNHNKEFLYKPRGFNSIGEMNEAIIKNLKACVGAEDHLYILGDLCFGPNEEARTWLEQIPGKVTVIVGNHDTDSRLALYEELGFKVMFAARMRYGKYHFFLSHYQTLTENSGEDYLTNAHINLYGHTHQNWIWTPEYPHSYCVCPEANNCFPHEINEIIAHLRTMLQLERFKKAMKNSGVTAEDATQAMTELAAAMKDSIEEIED